MAKPETKPTKEEEVVETPKQKPIVLGGQSTFPIEKPQFHLGKKEK
jgi:hypothetical protein